MQYGYDRCSENFSQQKMNIVRFLNKCRRCGEITPEGETAEYNGWRFLQEAVIYGVSTCNNGIPLSMVSTHQCKDGGHGVTDLIGCERISADKDEIKAEVK